MEEERLKGLFSNQKRPIQLIIAVKAHQKVNEGKEIIKKILLIAKKPEFVNISYSLKTMI